MACFSWFKKREGKPPNYKRYFFYVVGVCILYAGAVLPLLNKLFTWLDIKNEQLSLGTFGDSFGALNTLFSGLAFAGIAYSIKIQREELQQAKEQNEQQKKDSDRQKFESIFFQLLQLYTTQVQNLTYRSCTGRPCFSFIQRELFKWFFDQDSYKYQDGKRLNEADGDRLIRAYETFFNEKIEGILGHYFRNFCNIVKFIDETKTLTSNDKKFFVGILNAQLDSHEIMLLFFNGLSKHGAEEFKRLIERYALLEQLPTTRITSEPFEVDSIRDSLSFGIKIKNKLIACVHQYNSNAFGDSEEWREFFNNHPRP